MRALVGASVARRHLAPRGARPGRAAPLDLAVLRRIVLGWAVTIPLALALALLVYAPLRAGLSRRARPGDEQQ